MQLEKELSDKLVHQREINKNFVSNPKSHLPKRGKYLNHVDEVKDVMWAFL